MQEWLVGVWVREEDLRWGICGSPLRCALARAIRRHMPAIDELVVQPRRPEGVQARILYMPDGFQLPVVANLPEWVVRKLKAWDRGFDVSPFFVTLRFREV